MAEYTEHYNLKKPSQSESYDIDVANTNNEIIDKALFGKAEKKAGKDLSTNDFTDEYKAKLDKLKNYDDKIIKEDISSIKADQTAQNKKIADLEEDNQTNKQDILEIKTKNITQDEYIETLQKETEDLKVKNALLEAELEDVQASGENITVNDSAEYYCNLELEGNSKQETREGYNLLNVPDIFSISSTEINKDVPIKILADTKCTIKIDDIETDNESIPYFTFRFIDENNADIGYISVPYIDKKAFFTLSRNSAKVRIYSAHSHAESANTNTTYKNLMIYEGTEDKSYEQYGAMPSPEFPSEVKSVGDSGSINEVISNKNLAYNGWAEDFVTRINNSNIAKLEAKDNRNCLKYGATAGYLDYDNKYVFKTNWKENTQYTFKFDYFKTNEINLCIIYTDETLDEFIESGSAETWCHLTKTSKPNKTIKYIRVYYRLGYVYIDLDTFMIEEGTEATDYIEHQSQTLTVNTQQPFRSIGDVRDRFVKVDEVWKEEHKIKKKIFDGTENIGTQTIKENCAIYKYIDSNIKPSGGFTLTTPITAISNAFPAINWGNMYNTVHSNKIIDGITTHNSANQIMFSTKDYLTLEEFKVYLVEQFTNGTPVYANYILSEPEYIDCTAEQIEQLEALEKAKTYYETTHIYSKDEIAPNVSLEYKKSNKLRLKNIENVILSLGGEV